MMNLSLLSLVTYGVLGLSRLPGDWGGDVLCGPRGCLAPSQSLVAAHGFWIMVIVTAVIGASARLSSCGVGRLGLVMAPLGGLATIVLTARSLVSWESRAARRQWWHPLLHAVLDVAMFVDVPAVELLPTGPCGVPCARRRQAK